MIEHASRDEPLQTGEILGSGTVGDGSAAERGESLQAGDRVVLTMDVLGTLSNHVAAPRLRNPEHAPRVGPRHLSGTPA